MQAPRAVRLADGQAHEHDAEAVPQVGRHGVPRPQVDGNHHPQVGDAAVPLEQVRAQPTCRGGEEDVVDARAAGVGHPPHVVEVEGVGEGERLGRTECPAQQRRGLAEGEQEPAHERDHARHRLQRVRAGARSPGRDRPRLLGPGSLASSRTVGQAQQDGRQRRPVGEAVVEPAHQGAATVRPSHQVQPPGRSPRVEGCRDEPAGETGEAQVVERTTGCRVDDVLPHVETLVPVPARGEQAVRSTGDLGQPGVGRDEALLDPGAQLVQAGIARQPQHAGDHQSVVRAVEADPRRVGRSHPLRPVHGLIQAPAAVSRDTTTSGSAGRGPSTSRARQRGGVRRRGRGPVRGRGRARARGRAGRRCRGRAGRA